MAIYYYCSRIMPNTKCWEDLKSLLNMDLEGKRRKITYISGCINDKSKSKSYRNGASKNLVELGIDMQEFTLLWKNGVVEKKILGDMTTDEMSEQILESDLVYLLGGNPHDQTRYIKGNNLDTILHSYNGIIVGVSSGSMTMSENVIVPPCGEKYPTQDVRKGIGLTNLSVFPHIDYSLNQETIETKDGNIQMEDLLSISNSYDILGLPNESIIRCSNDAIHLIGDLPHLLSGGNVYDTKVTEEQLDDLKVKKLSLVKK